MDKNVQETPKRFQMSDDFKNRIKGGGFRQGFMEARMTQDKSMLPGHGHTNQVAGNPGRPKARKNPAAL